MTVSFDKLSQKAADGNFSNTLSGYSTKEGLRFNKSRLTNDCTVEATFSFALSPCFCLDKVRYRQDLSCGPSLPSCSRCFSTASFSA
jgi:hypothetical protein